jgi:hypothetical protein
LGESFVNWAFTSPWNLWDVFTRAGFDVERVVEHQPGPDFADADPQAYEQVRKSPGFIAFRLRPTLRANEPKPG